MPRAQRDALRQWPDSPHFDAPERACLALTEVHAIDAAAITDAQAEAVKQYFGDEGLVALLQALVADPDFARTDLSSLMMAT